MDKTTLYPKKHDLEPVNASARTESAQIPIFRPWYDEDGRKGCR